MSKKNDPLGLAADRIAHNAQLTTLSAAIAAWTGDSNGRKDLQIKAAEVSFRLNALTTLGHLSTAPTGVGTAFAGFGIGGVSTD